MLVVHRRSLLAPDYRERRDQCEPLEHDRPKRPIAGGALSSSGAGRVPAPRAGSPCRPGWQLGGDEGAVLALDLAAGRENVDGDRILGDELAAASVGLPVRLPAVDLPA